MANMVYFNPFGAAAEGKQKGIEDVLKLGEAGRKFRDSDFDYGFRKWYDPYMRNLYQANAAVGVDTATHSILQNAAKDSRYLGSPDRLNSQFQQVYGNQGVPQGTRTPDQQTLATDIYSGALPAGAAYPDVLSAGPGTIHRNPYYGYDALAAANDPLASLRQQAEEAQLRRMLNPQGTPNRNFAELPQVTDPMAPFRAAKPPATQAPVTPKLPPISNANPFSIPQDYQEAISSPSIFADERNIGGVSSAPPPVKLTSYKENNNIGGIQP